MIQTVRVKTAIGPDLVGDGLLSQIRTHVAKNSIKKIESARVYRLEGIDTKTAKLLARKLLFESINQEYSINNPIIHGAKQIIEISYRPGVMNPEVGSILKAAEDLNIKVIAADSAFEYGFFGESKKADILDIINRVNLYNPTIEYIVRKPAKTLVIKDRSRRTKIIPIRSMSNEELLLLSKDRLYLNLEEMKVIQKYFKKIRRDPTDCELETLAQTWSEHCAHKTFKAKLIVDGKEKKPLIERIKKEALKHSKNIVSAFVDNSGVMDFYDGWAINGKVETHNSPSAIEPYGGAATGSGGVFRDVLGTGLGAKVISSTDIFCFAPVDMDLSKLPQGCLPPDYLLKQVVKGVKDYGNRMGIPTNNGSVHFHDDFRAKPTVIVGAYGILPKNKAKKGIVKKGDLIVAVGGRTGKDGIHGATFSSAEMTESTKNINSSAVQIGNAIEEKRMFDALLEARDLDLIQAMQDCGAGGFSSAIGEMGEEVGVNVDLSKALLKYKGLSPWEIFLSESQERMVVAILNKNVKKFLQVCKKYNVEASMLGVFDGSRKLRVYYKKSKVCDLDMEFLHHGLPQRIMEAKRPNYSSSEVKEKARSFRKDSSLRQLADRTIKVLSNQKEWKELIKKIISHPNIASKEPIVRLYDHTVQGTNSMPPYSGEQMDGPNDAAIVRPLLEKPYGMVIAHGLNPVLNIYDPYWGSLWAGVEALSNYVAVGGDYRNATLINNYIWPFPDSESLYSLDKSVDAVVDLMKTFEIPVISGKDSLSSTYRGKDGEVIKIPPVLCISVFGKIPDVSKTVSSDFKKTGSVICLVGSQDVKAFGGSIYSEVLGIKEEKIPYVDLKKLPQIFTVLNQAIEKGKILSCHDVSEGGMITSIFEMCVGGGFGALLNLDGILLSRNARDQDDTRGDHFLFNETAGCFVVEVENEKVAKNLFGGIPFEIIGKTMKRENLEVFSDKKKLFEVSVLDLKKAWQKPMRQIFP